MLTAAVTSAEISLPATPDAVRVRERIAMLADTVDVVGLTDNHAGQPRMSPLAAVALAREQGVALLRNERMADRARTLPGCLIPDQAYRQIRNGGGIELATEIASELATIPGVDALHIYPLGAERATRDVAASFRTARGVPAQRR